MKKIKINIKYIDNKFYISKGNSYSLLLGLKNVKSRQCIFLDGDVVIKSEILKNSFILIKKFSSCWKRKCKRCGMRKSFY